MGPCSQGVVSSTYFTMGLDVFRCLVDIGLDEGVQLMLGISQLGLEILLKSFTFDVVDQGADARCVPCL